MQELGLVLVRSDELWTDKTEVELVQALDSGFLLRARPDCNGCEEVLVRRTLSDHAIATTHSTAKRAGAAM
jgi:hypothetical protein